MTTPGTLHVVWTWTMESMDSCVNEHQYTALNTCTRHGTSCMMCQYSTLYYIILAVTLTVVAQYVCMHWLTVSTSWTCITAAYISQYLCIYLSTVLCMDVSAVLHVSLVYHLSILLHYTTLPTLLLHHVLYYSYLGIILRSVLHVQFMLALHPVTVLVLMKQCTVLNAVTVNAQYASTLH